MEEFFAKYTSNTLAGTGNQSYFVCEGKMTGRAFYKVFAGGTYNYSFLFGNIVDSTYADGTHSHANFVCDAWEMRSLKVAVTKTVDTGDIAFTEVLRDKHVAPGEFFYTEPVTLSAEKGDYICLEMVYEGHNIPYLEEILIPAFVQKNGEFVQDNRVPLAAMIGCDRKVEKKVVFWGDSITQGLGTTLDKYEFWVAKFAEKLGDSASYWNLGIGYARAKDAATGGAWFYKAKHCDIAFFTLGTNDLLHEGTTPEVIERNIQTALEYLKPHCKIALMTPPPFDFAGKTITDWQKVCDFEKTLPVDFLFETSTIWGKKDAPHLCQYGGHPNAEGCEAMAEALSKVFLL